MKGSRLPYLALALLLFALAVVAPFEVLANCQYCSRNDPRGGICNDVLSGSPFLPTLSNCEGILRCRRALNEEFCVPDCDGNPCFWV